MPGPDDHRFRPDDPAPDDYDVGDDYSAAPPPTQDGGSPFPESTLASLTPPPAPPPPPVRPPAPVDRPGLPYGATGQDAAGGVPGAPPVAGPVPPGAPPPSLSQSGHRGPVPLRQQPARRRLGCALGAVGVVLLVSTLAQACGALTGDDDAEPYAPATTVPELTARWVVTPADIEPGVTDAWELTIGLDGAFTGPSYVDAGEVLVVGYGPTHSEPMALAGLSAADGEVLWSRDLPQLRCGDQAFDGAVQCLSRQDDGWRYHRVDVATGDDLVTADVPLNDVLTVHAGPDGLVAVGPASPAPHADVWGFGLDGERLWKIDIGEVDGAELLFDDYLATQTGGSGASMERPRWRDLDGGLMMLWVTNGAAVVDPRTGETFAHACRRVTTARDHYFCQDDAGINRRDLTGAVQWSLPDLELAYVPDTSDGRPVAVSAVYELIPVDWETGEVTGPAIHRFDPQPGGFTGTVLGPSALGDARTQYVEQDGEIVLKLADDADEVDWVFDAEARDIGYVSGALTLDGVTLLDSSPMVALDTATGEVLWERHSWLGLYPHVHGDDVVTIGLDEIALLELP